MKRADMSAEQRTARNLQNKKARETYEKANYKIVSFRLRLDGRDGFTYEQLKRAANVNGYSINSFILDALRDKI